MHGSTLRRAWLRVALMGMLVAVAGVLASAQPAAAQRVHAHNNPPSTATILGIVPPLRPLGANLVGAAAAAAPNNLSYHGGPVMRTNTTYLIYWVPSGAAVSSGYQSTITGFFQNVAAASGATSNVYSTTPQYYDTTGNIAYQSTFGGAAVATNPFPANGCTDPGGRPTCLSDTQLRAEIATVMAAQGWTAGPTKMFFIFTPRNVGSCWAANFCSYREFCAYHSATGSGSSVLIYANQPYAGGVGGCDTGQHPNGDEADATINVASHEHAEAITDPQLNAWYDTATGNENGDNCAWTFGTPLGGTSGSYYNQVIGSGHYYLQREWSNATSSCVLLTGVGSTTRFTVTAAASSVAGAATSVTVVARDDSGNAVPAFRGTVAFTSSDGLATLPANYTFTATDNGTHTFTTSVLRTPGSQTITATSGSITGAATITVNAGTISRFSVSGPTTLASGVSGSFTVTALNSAGYRIAGYRGTAHFTSTDPAATLPGNTAFSADDAGAHAFTVTPRTTGARVISVRDTVTTAAVGTATTTVTAGTLDHFTVTAAASSLAGAAVPVTVSARDASNNVVTGFRGIVRVTSSDSLATLPADYTFTATDNGTHVFTSPLFRTPGSQTVTATTGSVTGSVTVSVAAGAVTHFSVSGPTTLASGASGSWTLTALNGANFRVSGYRGTVHLTSTDPAATLPDDTTFSAEDAGAHAFSVTLRTSGGRAIGFRDTVTTAANGTVTVTVAAGTATRFVVTAAASSLAGAALATTVSARDTNNNVANGFRGVVTLTSSDSAAVLPVAYTFTASDNGTHLFTSPVLRTPGSQTLTATSGGSTGSVTVSVAAGAVTHFSVTGPTTLASGSEGSYTVTALNAANFRVAGYTGTVHFTSSDSAAVLPADTAFTGDDAGAHVFPVTLKTSGARSVAVRDTVATAATGTASTTVGAGAATHFTVTTAASTLAGAALTTTVVARDANNNVATGFRGLVHLSSTDSAAVLPGDYTFTAGDNGTHAFATPRLRTVGSQTITATSGGSTGTATATVIPGTATHLVVTLAATATAGLPVTFTVTALDAANNVATGYRGSVHLLSSDVAATLGADAAFSAGDAGVHTFTATLRTAGSQTVTARSTTAPLLTALATTTVSA